MRIFLPLALVLVPIGANACTPSDTVPKQADRFALEVFDANGDGQVSRAEFSRCENQLPAADILLTPDAALFDRLDADTSGSLDAEELRRLAPMIRQDIALDADDL